MLGAAIEYIPTRHERASAIESALRRLTREGRKPYLIPLGASTPLGALAKADTAFANFGSVGIMIGGMGTLAPSRRNEVVALSLRAMLAGTIASCMTGATAGILAG